MSEIETVLWRMIDWQGENYLAFCIFGFDGRKVGLFKECVKTEKTQETWNIEFYNWLKLRRGSNNEKDLETSGFFCNGKSQRPGWILCLYCMTA